MTSRRAAAERRGRIAEWVAAVFLMAKGYRILGHRLRTPYGEVDLAAWHRGVLVIIEVKAGRQLADGVFAVTTQQQRRIVRAAEALAGRWRITAAAIRFDIIVVRGLAVLTHRRGAFDSRD